MKKMTISRFCIYFFITICISSCTWGAGSYCDSEVYLINISSPEELIIKIVKLKQINPELNMYHKNEEGISNTMDDESQDFYTCYFMIDNIGYMCVINLNQRNQQNISFQFVSIARKEEIEKGNWKQINTSELTKSESEAYKKIFEERILNHLDVSWKKEVSWFLG